MKEDRTLVFDLKRPRSNSFSNIPNQPNKTYIPTLNVRTLITDDRLEELKESIKHIKWEDIGTCEVRRIGEEIKEYNIIHYTTEYYSKTKSLRGTAWKNLCTDSTTLAIYWISTDYDAWVSRYSPVHIREGNKLIPLNTNNMVVLEEKEYYNMSKMEFGLEKTANRCDFASTLSSDSGSKLCILYSGIPNANIGSRVWADSFRHFLSLPSHFVVTGGAGKITLVQH
ncbi:unnamed protein product [Leptidea sinapis]|uniref:Uncharacterized protein n=1 Tax=Leptidea sinapis TaxID=189913 RepID=A0A5E4QUP4_9NEOP|nr:unnamed protein product [Leptidea sinapis]